MYKLCFFVPESHLESVKSALFKQGAGALGDYDRCAWQVLGHGQFRPLAGSKPFLGEALVHHNVEEYRVEMVVTNERIKGVIECLLSIHPYEQPAYEYWQGNASLDSISYV